MLLRGVFGNHPIGKYLIKVSCKDIKASMDISMILLLLTLKRYLNKGILVGMKLSAVVFTKSRFFCETVSSKISIS